MTQRDSLVRFPPRPGCEQIPGFPSQWRASLRQAINDVVVQYVTTKLQSGEPVDVAFTARCSLTSSVPSPKNAVVICPFYARRAVGIGHYLVGKQFRCLSSCTPRPFDDACKKRNYRSIPSKTHRYVHNLVSPSRFNSSEHQMMGLGFVQARLRPKRLERCKGS